jgi:hypothetical protein
VSIAIAARFAGFVQDAFQHAENAADRTGASFMLPKARLQYAGTAKQ